MGIETYSEETLKENFLTVTQLAQLLQVPKSWVYGQTMNEEAACRLENAIFGGDGSKPVAKTKKGFWEIP